MSKNVGGLWALMGVLGFVFYQEFKTSYIKYPSSEDIPKIQELLKEHTEESLDYQKIDQVQSQIPYEEKEIIRTRNGNIEYFKEKEGINPKLYLREDFINEFYIRNQFKNQPIYDVDFNERGERIFRVTKD